MRFIVSVCVIFIMLFVNVLDICAGNDSVNINENVQALLELNIINENDIGQTTVSREKCIIMVCKAIRVPDDEIRKYRYMSYYRPVFSDISFEKESSGYIFYAGLYGIALGIPDGYMVAGIEVNRFNPDENVTYQEAVTFIMRALESSESRSKISINDAIELAKEKGIICATDSFFDKMESNIVFEDLCILIHRMLEYVDAD